MKTVWVLIYSYEYICGVTTSADTAQQWKEASEHNWAEEVELDGPIMENRSYGAKEWKPMVTK